MSDSYTAEIINVATGAVIGPIANGGSIPPGTPPCTIAIVTHGINVTKFSIDNGEQITQEASPRCINYKPPIKALNLSTGVPHTVTIDADGTMLEPFVFTIDPPIESTIFGGV